MVSEDVMEARSRRLGLQHENSVDQAVLVEGTSMSWRSAERRCARPETPAASDWDADVVKVGRTVLTDTVKRRDCYFKLYLLWHCEPMKHVAKNRRDVFVRYVQLANRVFIHKVEKWSRQSNITPGV